jgi:hypothetical protein
MRRLEVFHQLGFRHSWNFQSLQDDQTGDGVILAPRYLERVAVEELEPRDKDFALFDPQFFLPSTPKGKLATYSFFPEVAAGGFSTSEFPAENGNRSAARASAEGCVRFQVQNGFPYVVIPTRYLDGLPSDFIAKQSELFVEPFLAALEDHPDHRPVVLQLILNDLMLKNPEYRSEILNWVTGIPGLAGVYLIISASNRRKQLKDPELLEAALRFIAALDRNAIDVFVGYTNTEALLLSIAGPRAVTVGCYENMRMFNIRTFQDDEDSDVRGPTPRLYVSRLLQWVSRDYLPFIRRVLEPGEVLFDENGYQAEMFKPSYNWHFTKPELYKHGILEFWKQLRTVGDVFGRERYERVAAMINTARGWYSRFEDAGIAFDQDNDGSHLPLWLTVANQFAREQGWR